MRLPDCASTRFRLPCAGVNTCAIAFVGARGHVCFHSRAPYRAAARASCAWRRSGRHAVLFAQRPALTTTACQIARVRNPISASPTCLLCTPLRVVVALAAPLLTFDRIIARNRFAVDGTGEGTSSSRGAAYRGAGSSSCCGLRSRRPRNSSRPKLGISFHLHSYFLLRAVDALVRFGPLRSLAGL